MAVSSRTLEPALYRYRFGSAEFDEARFELTVGGLPIELENKPLRVLGVLLRQHGRVVSKAELKKDVWDDRLTVEQVLTNAITKLRKALGEEGQAVVTVPRLGYRLTGPIQRVAVGQRLLSRLRFSAGDRVPGRDDFVLEAQLGATQGSEVWRASNVNGGPPRVFKFSIDGEHLAMLKREATISRLLKEGLGERDDFVRVLDWNFETAPFHLECEYAGESLAHWAENGRLASLSIGERLALFLQIANAVAAAHGVGVLHRDLKPDNVLVEARGEREWRLRVTDFGSGRLLDPERLAELGATALGLGMTRSVVDDSRTGTPLYLAPELITGQPPTIRTDVYALGYMLYQIVVADLSKPMATGWERDIDDELLREDIAAATEGDPSRRLAGVSELIDRLGKLEQRRADREHTREIESRAVAAERALDRAKARRPWLYAVGLSLFIGLVASLWLYHQQRVARIQAQRETARAETVNRFLNNDLLGAADPGGPGASSSLGDVLSKAAARLSSRFSDDPETEAALALTIGNSYFGLSDYTMAETYQRRAMELFETTRGARDPATLEAAYRLARSLETDNRNEAEALLARADANAGKRLTENSELALLAHWARGGNWLLQGQPDKALNAFEAMERVRQSVDPTSELWLLRSRENLAWCYIRLGRAGEAEKALRPLLQDRYSANSIGVFDWAKVRMFDGFALAALGRYEEAERMTKAALEESEAKLGSDHYLTAVALWYLVYVYQQQGDWDMATQYARRAHEIVRQRFGEQALATVDTLGTLGAVDLLSGRREQALRELRQAYEGLMQVSGPQDPRRQTVAFYLAAAYHAAGRDDDALSLLTQVEVEKLSFVEPGPAWPARVRGLQGQILLNQGNVATGRSLISDAIGTLVQVHAPDWQVNPLRQSLSTISESSVAVPVRRR